MAKKMESKKQSKSRQNHNNIKVVGEGRERRDYVFRSSNNGGDGLGGLREEGIGVNLI